MFSERRSEHAATFWRGLVLACFAALSIAVPAAAGYPEPPIRIVVPYAGAGTMDIVRRILFERCAEHRPAG